MRPYGTRTPKFHADGQRSAFCGSSVLPGVLQALWCTPTFHNWLSQSEQRTHREHQQGHVGATEDGRHRPARLVGTTEIRGATSEHDEEIATGGRSAIEAETGIRPRGVLDIDPHILTQNAQGQTVIDAEAVQGKQGASVKAHLDSLLAMQSEMADARNAAQEMMLDSANKKYAELKKETIETMAQRS